MSVTSHQFIKQGNLFIVPVGQSIDEAPYPTQSLTKPPDFSLWVHGKILEPGLHLDQARMSTGLCREVRNDLTRFSPVEVTRSAFRRSSHAYVGVIDSRGTPYYFALDSRGVSVREASPGDVAWKAFDRLATDEHMAAVRQRRSDAASEMRQVDRELSEPIVVTKGIKYGKKVEWKHDVPHSSWWRHGKTKQKKPESEPESTAPTEKSDDANRIGARYAAEMRRVGAELSEQNGESDLDPPRPEDALWLAVEKALPKKSKEPAAKKTPSRKASKKQAGTGGKTRYTYPQDKKGARGAGQVPLVVVHDDTKRADPAELANQLGVSVRTLTRTARQLGSDGFATFMRARLKRFATKHRLDPDYWNTLYANLVAAPGSELAKSDDEAAWKKFGDNVKEAASAVPKNHRERFGDRKVFIHHVHSEMKRHGTYSGNLDEFKNHVVAAHQKGHLVAARADLVAGMNHDSVKHSETKADGASFNFITDVKHDPEATKRLGAKRHEESPPAAIEKPSKLKLKTPPKSHHDAARALSDEAVGASAHADKTRTSEAHLAAMASHHKAGTAHQKASGKLNHKVALAHFDRSVEHLKAAKAGAT